MKQLLAAAWAVFALDLVVLGLMVKDLFLAAFGDTGPELATVLTAVTGAWIAVVGLILVASWWRSSRGGLWVSLVCGALPLLWAWSKAVQAITEWASTPR